VAVAGDKPGIDGRRLGDFVVVERLGEGGHGVVYRAEQPTLGRDAVVKVLHERHRDRGETVERFLREARLASKLDHPYAAHVYAFGAEPDGLLWIAMEHVRGTPLDRWLRTHGPFALDALVPLFDRLCEVVHTAHEQGIIHRDIKPANVMVLSRAGRLLPKLLDFGVGKAVGDTPAPVVDEDADLPRAAGPDVTRGRLGSPVYMAPELWTDAAAADARADLYALAITAYEALTGKPPYRGPSLRDLALAHARAAPPPLGEGFPAALDAVFARALAKTPGDRYVSALELAEAFRAGSGIEPGAASLPGLDPALRDELLASAPQPIAEAVSVLDAARNAHQALDAVEELVGVTTRYAALVALAARTRVAAEALPPATTELLRALRRRVFTDDEWRLLWRSLVAPHAAAPAAHPVPELVAAATGDGSAILDAIAALRSRIGHAAGASDLAARDLLADALPTVAAYLRRLAPVCAYEVVVAHRGAAETWRGLRRPRRPALAVRPSVPDGEVALVAADGRAVVKLSPLVVAAEPTPGAARELFFLDGHDHKGALFVALPAGFERHDDRVWDWLREQLPDLDDGDHTTSGDDRPPYPGLSAFSAAHADHFFGRERETEAVVNRLRVHPLVAVVGPSGAGKSSFVHAGVAPALGSTWRTITTRPGRAPLAALAGGLAAAGIDAGDLAADANALGAALRADAAARGPIVLVVDQLEELFTLGADPRERDLYAAAIVAAARAAEDPVRVVLTLRDDFLLRADAVPALRARLAPALELLSVPAAADLVRIIVEPARRAGYELDDPALARDMVDEVADRAGALALLSFTTARLWELRDRHFRQLTRAAYRAVGGVGGALAQHADRTVDAMTAEERRLARVAFRNLVTADGTRAVLTRAELAQVLGGGDAAESVIEKLVAARLVVAAEDATGTATVEIVHEALLAAWPRLAEWRREDAETARLRDQLRDAARQWIERGRPDGLLWRGDALAELARWRARSAGPATEAERAFADASARAAARGRRIRTALLATAFAVLAGGVAVLLTINAAKETERQNAAAARARAEESDARSRAQVAELHLEQGRRAYLAGDVFRAAAYLEAARTAGATGAGLAYLRARTAAILDKQGPRLAGHKGEVWSVAFFPDGRHVVTAGDDSIGRIWDATTGAQVTALTGHAIRIFMADVSADGTRVITGGEDGTARIWDAVTGAELRVLRPDPMAQTGWITTVRFSPDGKRVLTAGTAGTARVWDAATGDAITVVRHAAAIYDAQFTPDGRWIVTASGDGTAVLWSAVSGMQISVVARHAGTVTALAIGPDSRTVVTGWTDTSGQDGGAALWRTGVSRALAVRAPIRKVALSPDGTTIALPVERDVQLWSADTREQVGILRGHAGVVTSVTFSRDGGSVVTTSQDNSARVWDARTAQPLALVPALAAVTLAAISPDASRVAIGGIDGAVATWSTRSDALVRTFDLGESVSSALLDPSGDRVVACGGGGAMKAWPIAGDEAPIAVHAGKGSCLAAFTRDGFITASDDGAIRRWDASGRAAGELAPAGASPAYGLAVSHDGRRAATGHDDDQVRVWNAETGALAATLAGHAMAVYTVAWSGDDRRLASCSRDGTVREWDTATGTQAAVVELGGVCQAASLDADAGRLVAATGQKARLFAGAPRAIVRELEGHRETVGGALFGPSGLVVTLSFDRVAAIWDAATGRQLDALVHAGLLFDGDVSITRALLVTRAMDRVYAWSLAPAITPAREAELLAALPLAIVDGLPTPRSDLGPRAAAP
jgi:WD40 repeat protein/tRNA A-37 threonylcarbamoyl transferase component Bud32